MVRGGEYDAVLKQIEGTEHTRDSICGGAACPGSWFRCPQAHRWPCYSNAGGVAKEIDHVLVDGRWRMIQNCRVYRSAQFLNTDHRLGVATRKLQLKSRRMEPSQPWLDVGSSGIRG